MKKIFLILLFSSFATIIIFVSCKKDNSNNYGLHRYQANSIKARFVEYGLDPHVPVEGLTFSVCTSFLASDQITCGAAKSNLTSNSNGEIVFEASEYGFVEGEKTGYWPVSEKLITYFGDNPLFKNGIHSADSFLVKLVRRVPATLHIKNNISSIYGDVMLMREGIFASEGSSINPGDGIILRPNIDTTIQYELFGNTSNFFVISDFDVDDAHIYFKETKFYTLGSPTLYITY